eukprot:UN00365
MKYSNICKIIQIFTYINLKIRPTNMIVNICGKFPVRELDPRIYCLSLSNRRY